jgi:hypothetical protein
MTKEAPYINFLKFVSALSTLVTIWNFIEGGEILFAGHTVMRSSPLLKARCGYAALLAGFPLTQTRPLKKVLVKSYLSISCSCKSCGKKLRRFPSQILRQVFCSKACRRLGIEKRIWPKVDASGGVDACHPFTGARTRDGYGILEWRGEFRAHRIAFILSNGRDYKIPNGMCVLHKCNNPARRGNVQNLAQKHGVSIACIRDCWRRKTYPAN